MGLNLRPPHYKSLMKLETVPLKYLHTSWIKLKAIITCFFWQQLCPKLRCEGPFCFHFACLVTRSRLMCKMQNNHVRSPCEPEPTWGQVNLKIWPDIFIIHPSILHSETNPIVPFYFSSPARYESTGVNLRCPMINICNLLWPCSGDLYYNLTYK